jgi:hypothetical protein
MKNQFTSTLLTTLLISSFFLSCTKEKDAGYLIRIKRNGEWATFTKAGFIIEATSNPDLYYLTVAGRSTDMKEIFILGVEVPANPQPGTFDTENNKVEFGYGINGTPGIYYTMWPVTSKPNPNYTLTITSISENEVRGYFTGNYLADEDENFIEVTEGEFVAKKTE